MKHLVGDLPHHVPIRKENRWEPVTHYATAPNTTVVTIPLRRSGVPDLLMPERQESVSSFISQYSSQTRQCLSNRSLTNTPREDGDDDSTVTPFCPNQLKRQNGTASNITSSPCSKNSRYGIKQCLPCKSLFSNSSLATTLEEQKNVDEWAHKGYTVSLGNETSNSSMTQFYFANKNNQAIARLDDWFHHSDDSSVSQEEDPITKPYSGRSLVPIVHENNDTYSCKSTSDNQTVSESDKISEFSELYPENGEIYSSSPAPNRTIITEESVKRVLRESAPHSYTTSSDQTTRLATTGSIKLDQLREKMKLLRKEKHQQLLQSRFQLQRTRSSSQSKSKSNENQETADNHTFHSHRAKLTLSKEPMKMEASHRRILYSCAPHSSFSSSRCTSIVDKDIGIPTFENDYDPAFDPDIDINSSFDSSKRDWVDDQALENYLEEDLYINSSFDSSKCSTIAEQAVQSLREERLHINASFNSSKCASFTEEVVQSLKKEVRAKRQYDPGIHITRHYSMGKSVKKPNKRSSKMSDLGSLSSPTRSPLQEKLERKCRRSRSTRALETQKKIPVQKNNETSPEAKKLAQELKKALMARCPPIEAEGVQKHPWCDPFQSDGILPLASEDSLSSSLRAPPKSLQERRSAYLNQTGDSDENRRQSAFTTADWVLGKLPEKVPILYSTSQAFEEREHVEESVTKFCRGRPRKWTYRKNVINNMKNDVKNSGRASPGRDVKNWMSPNRLSKEGDLENNGRHLQPMEPLIHEMNLAQCSFVNRVASPNVYITPLTRNLVRSKSPKEKDTGDNSISLRRLTRNSTKSSASKRRDDPNRIRSSRRIVNKEEEIASRESSNRSLTTNKSFKKNEEDANNTSLRRLVKNSRRSYSGNERDDRPRMLSSRRQANVEQDDASRKLSIRKLIRSKSSKEKEMEDGNNSSFKRLVSRNPIQSSLDHPGGKVSSKLSQKLLRISSKSFMDEEMEGVHKRPSSKRLIQSNSKSSVDIARDSSSKGHIRSKSKSSVDRGRESSSKSSIDRDSATSDRKFLRSPSNSPNNRRDHSYKSYDAMGRTERSSNFSTTQKILSWNSTNKQDNGKNDEKKTKKASSRRFGSGFRNSYKDGIPKKPSSGRFGKSSRKKVSNDKEDDRKSKILKVAYWRLGESSEDDDRRQINSKPQTPFASASQRIGSSSRLKHLPSRESLTQKPSSRKLLGGTISKVNVDKRDDSNRSITHINKVIRPSSWRESGARSVGRNHSHLSNTATTINSDPSSIDSSSSSSSDSDSSSDSEGDCDCSSGGGGGSHPEEKTVVAVKNKNNNNNLNSSKHGRRTRPRKSTSHRSIILRLRRYKYYRKNGVIVGEQKRFRVIEHTQNRKVSLSKAKKQSGTT